MSTSYQLRTYCDISVIKSKLEPSVSQLLIVMFSGPIASTIINRYSCRVAMILGSLMLSTGLVLTGFVEDIKWTFFTFGILAGKIRKPNSEADSKE